MHGESKLVRGTLFFSVVQLKRTCMQVSLLLGVVENGRKWLDTDFKVTGP